MRGYLRALAVAAVALGIGVAFGPTFATAADSLKDVIVQNGDDNPVPTKAIGTTQVAGSVAVDNLPTAGDGSVRTSAAPPKVRWREFSFGPGALLDDVPTGVVVTDAVVLWEGGTSPCLVTLDVKGAPTFLMRFDISSADRTAEMHLESGLPSQEEFNRPLQWQLRTTGCVGRLLWTGYEA